MYNKEFEKNLWTAAKKLQNSSSPEERMHVVLGLVFLKYITDLSDDKTNQNPSTKEKKFSGANVSDQGEPVSFNEYFIPKNAQWSFIQDHSGQQGIGKVIDDAVATIEELNKELKDIFPKNYSDFDNSALRALIDILGEVGINKKGAEKRAVLATVFEFLLRKFAEAEGKNGFQFYTPDSISKLITEMAEPRHGSVYDGCCGTGSMFLQTERFIKKYRAKIEDVTFYGQDRNPELIKIARMNLAIHGLSAHLQVGDTLIKDCYSDLEADYIFSTPPGENGNYEWLQHYISKLSPSGIAGIALSSNSVNSKSAEERKVRRNLIEAGLIDCIVALPSRLFFTSDKPFSIWILSKGKNNNKSRDRSNEILFIDAHQLKYRNSGGKRELTEEHILLISRTYHRWKNINGDYIDLKGFCKAVPLETISKNGYSLSPQKYIGGQRVKKAASVLVLIIFLAMAYFLIFQNRLFTSKPAVQDTTLTAQPKVVSDSLVSKKKTGKEVKTKADHKKADIKDSAIYVVKNNPANTTDIPTDSNNNKPANTTNNNETKLTNNPPNTANNPPNTATNTPATAEDNKSIREKPEEIKKPDANAKKNNSPVSYKVISKAYFYNEPDERTRRNAFISHWNNSYANIIPQDEKNGFIYVVFTNHLNQTSRGWLRKKDLKEANQ